jgi:hypothetical protein
MNNRFTSTGALLCGLLLLFAAPGCSNSAMESQVSGVVTLDGQPVGPGTVVFVRTEGGGNPADGAIQIDGKYFLKTSRDVGLHPGEYKASVVILDQPPVKTGERSMTPAKLVSPKRYSDAETSGLEYEVKSGKNTIDIELFSK